MTEIFHHDRQGSSATLGISSVTRDRARRLGYIENLASDLSAADVAAIIAAEVGSTHPSSAFSSIFGALPLVSITVEKFGALSANFALDYARSRGGMPNNNTFSRKTTSWMATSVCRESVDSSDDPDFDSDGLPAGAMLTQFPDLRTVTPRVVQFLRPTLDIYVPFELATDPTNTVFSRVGHTNSGAVTYGETEYPANQLLFTGLSVTERVLLGTTTFFGGYQFRAQWYPFLRQEPVWDDTEGEWTSKKTPMFPLASFTSPAFPF